MTKDALTIFLQAIAQGNDDEAERLVTLLDHNAITALQAMLPEADPDLRWWAVRALAALEANPHSIAAMLDDEDDTVRACAALALAQFSYALAPQLEIIITPLVAHLADPDQGVGKLCALALARIGAPASPALVRSLEVNPQHRAARIHAARALLDAATPEAIPALVHALDDDSVTVQYYAEEALERLGVSMVFFKP